MKKILSLISLLALLGTTGCIVFPSHHKTVIVQPPAPVIVEPGH